VEKYQCKIVDWEGQRTQMKKYFCKRISRSDPSQSPSPSP